LAGPVFAAAVILPKDFYHVDLDDSKKIKKATRIELKKYIEKEAIAFSVAKMDSPQIDHYNILWASIRTMHLALDQLSFLPEHIIVDGNKFLPYKNISYECMVKGDGKYASIAAASILAKTYRDAYMEELHEIFPYYQWGKNKGYPTKDHRGAIILHGPCDFHRKSFQLYPTPEQLKIF
jgi:ribonuclease HII